MNSPARHASPLYSVTAPPLSGGNLAGAPSTGHFLSPLRSSLRAPCSVRLSRDARCPRMRGFHCVGFNRAVCMEAGRGLERPLARPPLPISSFFQPAHQFRADDTDRHHASGEGHGAAGSVLRKTSPRLFPSLHTDDFTHWDGSIRSLTSIREHRRRAFHASGKIIHASAC